MLKSLRLLVIKYIVSLKNGEDCTTSPIWAMGLLGVVTSLAMRKAAGFDFRMVHHNPLVQVGRTCSTMVREHGMGSSPLRIKIYLYMVWSAINMILMYTVIVH